MDGVIWTNGCVTNAWVESRNGLSCVVIVLNCVASGIVQGDVQISLLYILWFSCCLSLLQFLTKVPKHRLGCHPTTGASDIKGHAFFKPIDWNKLARRKLKPPYKPKIVSELLAECMQATKYCVKF